MRLAKTSAVFEMKWPVYSGGSAIPKGELLIPGVTADTDLGLLKLATATGLGSVGFLKTAIATTDTDSSVLGTGWNLKDIELIKPYYVTLAEYDLTTTMAVASNSSTTLTITSLENNIDTSWAYAVSGTGAGTLSFLVSSAAGSATQKTAMGWDSTTTCIKILRLFHKVMYLNATFDKLGTQAAVGTWTARVLNNKMKNTNGWKYLNPVTDDNLSGLAVTGMGTKFYAELAVLSSLAAVAS